MTVLLHDIEGMRRACHEARLAGRRVGLVPTMGALHEGHLSLVREARARGADFIAVTIFVNQLQFGPGEDFERYPRTLEADLASCEALGVDVVFAPETASMYRPGFQTHVDVGALTERLEGIHRPGHFRGVTTVVAKLFAITGPCVAVFGKKDYQQWRVLARMAEDLDLPVDVVAHPIVREPDGLALSSRNRYLSPEDRARALAVVAGLRVAHDAWSDGERNAETLRSLTFQTVDAAFDNVDYVSIADPDRLEHVRGTLQEAPLVLVAAHLGTTRLIDNALLSDPRP